MVLVGDEITTDKIKNWVSIVNREYNLLEATDFSVMYIEAVKKMCELYEDDDCYILVMPSFDFWGKRYLSVVSWYIKPERRNIRKIRFVQDIIINVAKKHKSEYIVQGSHLTKGFEKLMKAYKYNNFTFRRDL